MSLFWIGAAFGTMFGISFWMRERLREEQNGNRTKNVDSPGTTTGFGGGGHDESPSVGSRPSNLTPPKYPGGKI